MTRFFARLIVCLRFHQIQVLKSQRNNKRALTSCVPYGNKQLFGKERISNLLFPQRRELQYQIMKTMGVYHVTYSRLTTLLCVVVSFRIVRLMGLSALQSLKHCYTRAHVFRVRDMCWLVPFSKWKIMGQPKGLTSQPYKATL